MKYYVVQNDTIGGWDVSTHDKPASQHEKDEHALAWGLTLLAAEMIVRALNARLNDDT